MERLAHNTRTRDDVMAKRTHIAAALALLLLSTACVASEDGPRIDDCDHEGFVAVEQAAAASGPWQIPASTIAAGDSQYVTYTGAGPWNGESSCQGGMTSGANALRTWLQQNFGQISEIGGYSCRPIVGNASQTSVHATGRALDVHIPLDGGEADNGLGDPIGNYLIEHAEEIGIQYIIWDRWSWGAHRAAGDKSRAYGGSHPHHDHLHVELSVAAGNMQTAFFQGGMNPPDTGNTGNTGSGDVCAEQGWYGDGFCDTDCAMPDPDCSGGSTGEDSGSGGDGGFDLCEVLGWYGDGACDPLCPSPDPDCADTGDGGNTGNTGGGDICAEQGWYGDGICDGDCPNPDPDCADTGNTGNTGDTGGGDVCAEQGWYGDGVCDECPNPDPDCDGDTGDTGNTGDACRDQGFYGDGVCDDCPMPDPDCGDNNGDNNSAGTDGGLNVGETTSDDKDICERRGLYGDGVCDRSCPRFDSDCRDTADGAGFDEPLPDDPNGLAASPLTSTVGCTVGHGPSGSTGWLALLALGLLVGLARRRVRPQRS